MKCFYYESKFKIKKNLGGRGGGARLSKFILQKIQIKKKNVFYFFLLRIQIIKKIFFLVGGGGLGGGALE